MHGYVRSSINDKKIDLLLFSTQKFYFFEIPNNIFLDKVHHTNLNKLIFSNAEKMNFHSSQKALTVNLD